MSDAAYYFGHILFGIAIGFCFLLFGGCSQLQVITEQDKVNCLDFATSYAEIDNGQVIFGLYLPNQSTYHAWVKRRDGTCMDQMGQFECDDARYKEISVPSVGEINKLMGDRV